MASSPRAIEREREEERRLNLRTLTIASAASAVAAAVTSQLWIAGTWIAAALTPVLVALISEALHRPTERVARVWTGDRPVRARGPVPDPAAPERGASAPPAGETGPVRVYRQQRARPTRRGIAIGVVAATAALAFVIGIVALTTVDLVSGGSVGKGSGRTTLLGGGDSRDEAAPSNDEQREQEQPQEEPATPPGDEPDTSEPAPEEPAPEEPPSDTAPLPPPAETPPGEPVPEPAP